ncbi:MAG TPA: 3-deoxy-D-manno-octulosonic acid transferase [Candidatus Binatia bacterium]|nr:3-deoxy-D-manno-octulosonic acid transferase [Candidatus Binatia bacterium]
MKSFRLERASTAGAGQSSFWRKKLPQAKMDDPDGSKDLLLYGIYNCAVTLAFVVGLLFVPLLALAGERFRKGLAQRVGFYPRAVEDSLRGSQPVWIHAASVGEVRSAASLIEELRTQFPQRKIIASTFTYAGNRLARQVLPVDAVIILPLDLSWIVRRTLRIFQPSIIIFLETEIWPNWLRIASRQGIPLLLLSGRLSSRSLKNYLRFRFFFQRAVRYFAALGMQTNEDAERMGLLGVEGNKITVTGSLKQARSANQNTGQGLSPGPGGAAANFRGGPLWVVGSSHRGEEEIVLAAYMVLRRRFSDLRMVLAPRHPERFAEVERLLAAEGIDFEKKTQTHGSRSFRKDVLLLDTIGDLFHFYALADIAFVGGSLVDAGGHNILEPARCRIPVLFGPHMANFRSLAAGMKTRGGGIEVGGRDDLIREIADLLSNPERRKRMGDQAYQVSIEDEGVVERSLRLVCRYLQTERMD